MNHQQTRDHVRRHADAVVRGDMAAAFADMTEVLRSEMSQGVQASALPVFTSADVLSIDVGENETQAVIRYAGESGELTIRSHWRDQGGRPMIVRVDPVE